jgi:hypothetical protein
VRDSSSYYHLEFNYHLTNALRKITPDGRYQKYHVPLKHDETTCTWIEKYNISISTDVDAEPNGYTSLSEVFLYLWKHDSWRWYVHDIDKPYAPEIIGIETPQYEDTGDGYSNNFEIDGDPPDPGSIPEEDGWLGRFTYL